MSLVQYVGDHTRRVECSCGRCADVGDKPDPTGHTVDMFFFKAVAKGEPDAKAFEKLARTHSGEFAAMDPFDGKEHSYIELGAWIGDQGVALLFMALGSLLGLFKVITPNALPVPDHLKQQMAGQGMVTCKYMEASDGTEAMEDGEVAVSVAP